jgi:hypothetical protein
LVEVGGVEPPFEMSYTAIKRTVSLTISLPYSGAQTG